MGWDGFVVVVEFGGGSYPELELNEYGSFVFEKLVGCAIEDDDEIGDRTRKKLLRKAAPGLWGTWVPGESLSVEDDFNEL